MKKTILFSLLLISSCHEGKLKPICGGVCYKGDIAKAGKGVCTWGTQQCDEQGHATDCTGQGNPQAQTCNGLDNNCDGKIDSFSQQCHNQCGYGYEKCIEGVVSACDAPLPVPEICNGKDDDCNGIIDDADQLPIEFCYTGPSESLQYGECHPGGYRCVSGVKVCYGEKTPSAELCNGLDDNCNGAIDEGFNVDIDMVFIIDYSGSMQGSIAQVTQAISSWTVLYPDYKFALVAAPRWDFDATVSRIENFTDPTTFLKGLPFTPLLQSGSEPTIDALQSVLIDDPVFLALNWRQQSRKIVVIVSDETPQTYANPPVLEIAVRNLYATQNVTLLALGHENFSQLTSLYYPIDSNIQQHLQDAIKSITCGP